MKKTVKFFQIAVNEQNVFGLDSDGQVWKYLTYADTSGNFWKKLPMPEIEVQEPIAQALASSADLDARDRKNHG